jgi:hypothetical protein
MSQMLLLVHPYPCYDNGTTGESVEQTAESFDGDLAALLSRSFVKEQGRYSGDVTGDVTDASMRKPVHRGTEAYDALYLDRLGAGVPDAPSTEEIAAYDELLLGGGYTGYMTDEEHNAGCLMRCYDTVKDVVSIDLVPALTYCDVPLEREENDRTVLDRGETVVTVADMLNRQPVSAADDSAVSISALRDYALRQFDWETTGLTTLAEQPSFSRYNPER